MQKDIYVVTIKRGSKTHFSYGEKLKDALAVANPRKDEQFTYARFRRDAVTVATWNGNDTYSTPR